MVQTQLQPLNYGQHTPDTADIVCDTSGRGATAENFLSV